MLHSSGMYIRQTSTSRGLSKEQYTYRLVETERVNGKVKQRIVLNLGRHFDVPKSEWKALAGRIGQIINTQNSLFDIKLSVTLESMAQNIAARIIASHSSKDTGLPLPTFHSIDPDSMVLVRPRRVGVEHLALHAISQLGLTDKLKELGFNQHQLGASLGNIIARMAFPASERASHYWLQQRSGLGELIGYQYEEMPLQQLYRASDQLLKHKEALEKHLYQQERNLFGFEETITLYDLTNTFFEGTANNNPKASFGRSKEKRSDCPLVTLGLVLDGSGFPRKSKIFAGNVSESSTLETMLHGLDASKDAMVIMDAGIATQDNVQWLSDKGYRYLVVSRKRNREFDPNQAITVKQTPRNCVRKKNKRCRINSPNVLKWHCKAWRTDCIKKVAPNGTTKYSNALAS